MAYPKAIGQLFDIDRSVVAKHLQNVFADGELVESSVCAKFAQAAADADTTSFNDIGYHFGTKEQASNRVSKQCRASFPPS